MMAPSKILVVLGATGTQGRSVITSMLADNSHQIRGITRNAKSEKAAQLEAKGVNMVSADLDSPSTLDTAFASATALFAVTDFWGPFSDPSNQSKLKNGQTINEWAYEHELEQAKNIFQAAARVPSLEHLVWSTLASVKTWSKGKYVNVYHFDSKADATIYLREVYPALWAKTTIIMPGQYLTNHLSVPMLRPRRKSNGVFELRLNCPPDAPWPYLSAAEDTGPFAKALFALPPSPGKQFLAYREYISPQNFLETWGRINQVVTTYSRITTEEMAANPAFGLEGAESYAFVGEFGHEAREDKTVVHPEELIGLEKLPTVADWIRAQDWNSLLET